MKNIVSRTMLLGALGASVLGGASLVNAAPKTQTVRVIIDNAYKPATVSVKAGVPTKISFTLKSDSGCGNTVVIPALKKTLALKVGQTKTVSFTPKKNQTLAFACPMKMFTGKVVAHQ